LTIKFTQHMTVSPSTFRPTMQPPGASQISRSLFLLIACTPCIRTHTHQQYYRHSKKTYSLPCRLPNLFSCQTSSSELALLPA
jgi:hypothetical protein